MSITVYNEVAEPIVPDYFLSRVLDLYANGEQGALYYFTPDFAGLYQDAAGTTPVTAVGQPVGLMLDKSGNGNHASQATATARPTLRRDANGYLYLAFDGVDDCLPVPSIALPQPWERVSALRQNSWRLNANLFRQVGGNGGLVYQNLTSPEVAVASGASIIAGNLPVGIIGCLSERHNSKASRIAIAGLPPVGPVNMGALNSMGMNIGSQYTGSSNSGHVDFYGIVVRNGLLSDEQRQAAEWFVASRAGIMLPGGVPA